MNESAARASIMKRFPSWKGAVALAATLFTTLTGAVPPPVGPEHRVGGFVLGCQVARRLQRRAVAEFEF